jgi:hypothetical protein
MPKDFEVQTDRSPIAVRLYTAEVHHRSCYVMWCHFRVLPATVFLEDTSKSHQEARQWTLRLLWP